MENSQKQLIEKAISINAPVEKTWRVFTDPEITRQMGGEYVSEWKVGSRIAFKNLSGQLLTKGRITQIEDQKILEHELFGDKDQVISLIAYYFKDANGKTELIAKEKLMEALNEQALQDAHDGWDAALQAVKALAEQ